MPGFELIGDEEFSEIKHLFDHSKILRHGFDDARNDIYKVKEFEEAFAKKWKFHMRLLLLLVPLHCELH